MKAMFTTWKGKYRSTNNTKWGKGKGKVLHSLSSDWERWLWLSKIFQLSFRVFACAFPLVISSIFGKSFPFHFPYFVIFTSFIYVFFFFFRIEHLYPETLEEVPFTVFGYIEPLVAVFTTPNSEFNVLFPNLSGFRHHDHKFEWTRSQFEEWYNFLYLYKVIITFREFCKQQCCINYRNRFITQYITYLNMWGVLSRTFSSLQPMTDWSGFRILVGADLLPSTGFKMNFLVKWSAGGISKFIMWSLFFWYKDILPVC